MEHVLVGERANLHGTWNGDRQGELGVAPALTIESGDVVEVRGIPDVGWGLEPPRDVVTARRKVEPRDPARDAGPCMMGPIAVRGATVGDWIEVELLEITPGAWGFTYAGGSMGGVLGGRAWNERIGLGELGVTRWAIDVAGGVAREEHAADVGAISGAARTVALRAFLGTVGLQPAERGSCPWTPRRVGGNMDCRELVAGTRLFLPVDVEGGLLSLGDGHAAQGDGEIAGTAIECMMDRVRMRLTRHEAGSRVRVGARRAIALCGSGPIAVAPGVGGKERLLSFGFGASLDDAAATATSRMLDLIQDMESISRHDAAVVASTRVSLRITQLVNPHKGVHAVLEV
jgi:acetamidase/formamidase